METLEVNVYGIEELSEKARQRALEKHRHWNTEFIDWWDAVYECQKENATKLGFTGIKIWFSGFCSQGDGACFDLEDYDEEKFIEAIGLNELEKEAARRMNLSFNTHQISHHYSHPYTRRMEVSSDIEDDSSDGLGLGRVWATPDEDLPLLLGLELDEEAEDFLKWRLQHKGTSDHKTLADLEKHIEESAEELRVDFCKETYRALEKEYEYLTSDESIKESLECNGHKFLQDGTDCPF